MNYYVDVILPLPLNNIFTYHSNAQEFEAIQIGMRVVVPFGQKKMYTGICVKKHHQPPLLYDTKPIEMLLDAFAIVNPFQLKLWQWIADYYMCHLGEVLKAALPSHLLLENESIVQVNSDFVSVQTNELSDEEYLIFEALQYQNELNIQSIQKILNKKKVLPLVYKMLNKGIIKLKDQITEKYTLKLQKYIALTDPLKEDSQLNEALLSLEKVPKQHALLMNFFVLQAQKQNVTQKELLAVTDATTSVLNSLIKKNILKYYYLKEDRLSFESEEQPILDLTKTQAEVKQQIIDAWQTKQVTLLNAVTSSGKTEIYMSLIKETINEGKQVLFLVPEIALTTQMVSRFKRFFGKQLVVFHSKYNNQERTESYLKVLQRASEFPLVIGARSAMFLPFSNLGLIVVDEEHESNYKQATPAPRYHARDASIVMAQMHECKVLLGTATPSFETYYNTQQNKYALVTNKERYLNRPMPNIEFISLKETQKKKQMNGHFSQQLIEEIQSQLEAGKQVMLFQNRRGYAPVLECNTCGHIPMCPSCDVSLTYHSFKNQIRCHYCGYAVAKPNKCYACASPELSTKGFGTEQIELELATLFPKYNVGRMDHDTTKGKFNFESIINRFQNKEFDILVGTQMISKGLDFGNVGLVGVLQADQLLYQPDFRSFERAFQMLTQVAGRAGRGGDVGKVLIQTYHPEMDIMTYIKEHNFEGFYDHYIKERKDFGYPPFSKIIKIVFKCRDFNTLNKAAEWFANSSRNVLTASVLGPEEPMINKIKNEFIKQIMIKIPLEQNIKNTKQSLHKINQSFMTIGAFKKVSVQIHVDMH